MAVLMIRGVGGPCRTGVEAIGRAEALLVLASGYRWVERPRHDSRMLISTQQPLVSAHHHHP